MSKKTKKATVRTPVKDLGKGETIEHYNAVLYEDLMSKMELVIEGMEGTRDVLREDMRQLEQRITGEIGLLKTVVHRHSGDLELEATIRRGLSENIKENNLQVLETNKKIDTLQEGVVENTKNIKELKEQVGQMEKKMDGMETRLSEKIDTIGDRLDDHEGKPAAIAHP